MLALAATAGAAPAAAQQRRPMTFDDFISVRTPTDPRISPDGSLVAFTVTTPSLDDNRNLSQIWVVPANGGEARAVTAGTGNDHAPRWAPDGKSVAFVSSRDGGS